MSESDLQKFLKESKERVDPIIFSLATEHIERRFRKLSLYQFKRGGKRLRPALVFLSCKSLGGSVREALYPAAATEILHNCTLVADDIMDRSTCRSNKPTVWVKYGSSMAQCVGAYYVASIMKAVHKSPCPLDILDVFDETLKKMVSGEITDILYEKAGRKKEPYVQENRASEITLTGYKKMIEGKTASLFSACARIGGLCAKGSPKEIEALASYGMNVGLAFQIQDDILDIYGDEKRFGKPAGKDITEHKRGNAVIALAYRNLASSERRELDKILSKEEIGKSDVRKAIKLVSETKAKEKVEKMAKRNIDEAKKDISFLPVGKYRSLLEDYAEFVLNRNI